MEKDELIQAAKNNFRGLMEIESLDFEFSLEAAIYYYASNYHSGQFSDLYIILCNSPYKPGKIENFDNWKENNFEGVLIYEFFINNFER